MAVRDPKNLLAGIDWRARERFHQLASSFAQRTGLDLQVRSARRTCAEQADLYGIGRTYHLGKPPVTYARGCSSWHVLGRAVDADPVDAQGRVRGDCALYTLAGQLWEGMGGVWGGRFGGFGGCGDAGHFEWHPDVRLSELCPDPGACETVTQQIATVKPFGWSAAALSVAALGMGAALGYLTLKR